ncbi:MAG: hypothetical protein WKG01_18440 [Kofleriaceae bacterium]
MIRLALLFVLALAAPAHADPHYAIDVSSQVRWFGDTSAAILADKPIAGPQLTLSRQLATVDVPRRTVDLSVFGRFAFGLVDDQIFGALETSLHQYMFTGGLRGEVPLRWRFSLVGEAGLGIARTSVTITDDTDGTLMTPVDDHEWHALGTAAVGTELALLDHPAFALGLGVHVGYTLASPISLHAYPGDRPDDARSIPTMFAAIGDLDTRGLTVSAGLRGSF